MVSFNEVTLPVTKRSRKSIGAHSSIMDKENATIDVATTLAASRRKSRSKSIGPGGLDSLRQGSGNRRASLAAPLNLPRSILKPTIAPLPELPPLRKGRNSLSASTTNARGAGAAATTEVGGSKIALKTEEQQQAAAREREERERRDARRKSLANRRVSFAAEATLHTFHEVEEMNDAGKAQNSNQASADNSSGTQGNRRRSSLASQSYFSSVEDDTAASIYSSDSEPADVVEEIAADEEEEVEDEDSNSDMDDGTMVSVITEEITGTSMGFDDSVHGGAEAEESSTLDEALRMAARRAATQQLNDNSDDEEEIIPSFGWVKKGNQPSSTETRQPKSTTPQQSHFKDQDDEQDAADEEMDMDLDNDMDMEMTRPVGKIIRRSEAEAAQESEQDMSMDVTRAMGGILPQNKGQEADGGYDDPMDGATMEFTTAIGGIHRPESAVADDFDDDENEDMSMELTTIMGGLLKTKKDLARRRSLRKSLGAPMEDATMDMTVGLGQIISAPKHGSDEEEGDDMAMDMETVGMDMTVAVGGIIKNTTTPSPQPSEDIWLLGNGTSKPEVPMKEEEKDIAAASPSPDRKAFLSSQSTKAPESASTGLLATRTRALRQSIASRLAMEIEDEARTPSPAKQSKPSTPQQDLAPTKARGTPQSSPVRTPQSAVKRTLRSANTSRTPSPTKSTGNFRRSISRPNPDAVETRQGATVLSPQVRTPVRAVASISGTESPQIAAIFENRGSLVDSASKFVPGKRAVGFKDPKELIQEIDQDSNGDKRIESRSPESSQEKDATLNLREMINSMSPKRNLLRGRKSLHVGSAKGLLGKRPQELDEDEEAEENDVVKRLKGREGSPVKNVRLQQPPSKEETIGRLTNPFQMSLTRPGKRSSLSFSSPLKGDSVPAARDQGLLKDSHTVHDVKFHEPVANEDEEVQREDESAKERIHLHDFLNLTSIRFMELTTTKRRPTMMPAAFQHGEPGEGEDLSLERCVVAGACTVPMLELYQHSCRELKKYISEGRKIVKEIETETFEENPQLFQEYMTATPEVKAVMDNQFKNIKTHARHLSKAMWYEWRMKLQDGLKEGLVTIAGGMENDESLVTQEEDILASVMPGILSRHESLLKESSRLEEAAKELADSDPVQLEAAREELVMLDKDVAEKKRLIARLRSEIETSETDVEQLTLRKDQCLGDIKEAEVVREDCRGWTGQEVHSLRGRVDAIEKEHGWAVTGISGSNISMTYRREIELVFDMTSFQSQRPNSRIDLWYIGDSRDHNPQPQTIEKEFFLQCIRDHIRSLPQSQTKISDLLTAVQTGWDKAKAVSHEIECIDITFPTKVTKTSDSSIAITSSLLLVPLETRVEITLNLRGMSGAEGVSMEVSTQAKVLYGEQFNVGKVSEFLATRIGRQVGCGGEEWSAVVLELHEKLIARGKKT